jgi:PAS domain S-box-containing protein
MTDPMSTAPCAYFALTDEGTISATNIMLNELLGFSQAELEGTHIDSILPPGGRIFFHTYLVPLLRSQPRVEEIFLALRTKDGHDVPVLLNGSRRSVKGRFLSECVCLRMIQRYAYEDQLLEARRLAEESSAAKARFLSMISHDLRTPLSTIYGHAQLLGAGQFGPLNEEQRYSVGAVTEACQLQITMINDILEFARLDSGKLEVHAEVVVVPAALARAETLVRVLVEEGGLSLHLSGPENLTVWADPHRLQQILLNLLTNAVKFTPRGGKLSVFYGCDGHRVKIHVRDTGIGIAPEQLPRIFAPFVQVEAPAERPAPASRGVGLGLAISRDLARAMDGDVTVESTPGEGSVFTIDLPAAASATEN